jgi:DNA gyrase subunit A
MLRELDADTVDFGPNYDESKREPLVLPGTLPEPARQRQRRHRRSAWRRTSRRTTSARSIDAIVTLIDSPTANVEDLMKHVKGPDFPTGADHRRPLRHPRRLPHGPRPDRDARAGAHRGAARRQERDHRHRAALRREEGRRQRRHQEDGGPRQRQGADGDLRPRRPLRRSGMRIQIELKRDAVPQVALNKLFKHTALQATFGYNAVALVDGVPRTLSLLELATHYLELPARDRHAALPDELRRQSAARTSCRAT